MFDLTVLDYVYIGVLLASTIWATIRGGVYETVATLSWVLAAVVARFVSPMLDGILQGWGVGALWSLVLSYFIVFFVILGVSGFFNQKLRDRVQESMMKITDHTLGVVFGIIRGILVMGFVYWGVLWYYSDAPNPAVDATPECAEYARELPEWVRGARTLPIMQLTAVKIDDWFVPGDSMLLMCDMLRDPAADIDRLINQTVAAVRPANDVPTEDIGYGASERTQLENQLMQIDAVSDNQLPVTSDQ